MKKKLTPPKNRCIVCGKTAPTGDAFCQVCFGSIEFELNRTDRPVNESYDEFCRRRDREECTTH